MNKKEVKQNEVLGAAQAQPQESAQTQTATTPVKPLKVARVPMTEVIVIRPIEDGGSKRMRIETSLITNRRCVWMWEQKPEVILYQTDAEYKPVLRLDGASVTANALYDANNPTALHKCWKSKIGMIGKIAIGVMAVVAIALFILLWVWTKGNGGTNA